MLLREIALGNHFTKLRLDLVEERCLEGFQILPLSLGHLRQRVAVLELFHEVGLGHAQHLSGSVHQLSASVPHSPTGEGEAALPQPLRLLLRQEALGHALV